MIQQICAAGVSVSVCGDTTVSSFASTCSEISRYKIGFANLGEEQIPFAVDVRRGLEQAAKKAGNIDLILADYHLAEGVDGLQALQQLRGVLGELPPVAMITADGSSELKQKARALGYPVLHKPVRPAALRALLTALLRR